MGQGYVMEQRTDFVGYGVREYCKKCIMLKDMVCIWYGTELSRVS